MYPCLWHVETDVQRAMIVAPNAHAQPRLYSAEKVKNIMRFNSRVHYKLEFRFNANSLAVMFTEQDTIGVN